MRRVIYILFCIMSLCSATSWAADDTARSTDMVQNPILPGFNPDPSVCRVGDDYYLVTSSFMFYPGLPIYHSRDLVNWRLIGHALSESNRQAFHFEGLGDNDGIWAPTIRYHDGVYYIACSVWRGGGNFIITATDPAGPWSEPVWIPEAEGIDPTLFWDADGRSYYLGNHYGFKKAWAGQVGIYLQQIDLTRTTTGRVSDSKTGLAFDAPTYSLVGPRKTISYGAASNAQYAEGPHLYRIDGRYCLLMAEGGSGKFHAVTTLWADSLFGPYKAQPVNPVLTHRHMGRHYPVQNVGHADLVQLPSGEWWAVCLANRMLPVDVDGKRPYVSPLGRETWLCPVILQDGQFVFAPNEGRLTMLTHRPPLTPSPVQASEEPWYTPMTMPTVRLQKIKQMQWAFSRQVSARSSERGITVFRTIHSHYKLMRTSKAIELRLTERGEERLVHTAPCRQKSVELSVRADSLQLQFYVDGEPFAAPQSMLPLCDDGKYNKFNGTGGGMYCQEIRSVRL